MASIVEMTQLSPTMEEGVLVEWQKKEGEATSVGEVLASIETDKAVMDLEAFDEGILLKLLAQKGDKLPVGAPLAVLGEVGEDITELLAEAKSKLSAGSAGSKLVAATDSNEKPIQEKPPKSVQSWARPATSENTVEQLVTQPLKNMGRIKASPLAKNLAEKLGIDLAMVQGSGPAGRVVRRDVESAASNQKVKKGISRAADRVMPISMMRRTIAARLTDSKSHVPHFYLHKDIRVGAVEKLRKTINQSLSIHSKNYESSKVIYPNKVSLNDFIIKANALALKEHANVNAQWNDDSIVYKGNIDIGVAVAIEEGLLTPVIRNADQKTIFEISIEVRGLAERARQRKLSVEEYTGGSFTISNLGMYGIDSFEAIINEPEAALMAVGASNDKLEFDSNGEVVASKLLTATLSCDHRAVDGAAGALYLNSFAHFLENPGLLLS